VQLRRQSLNQKGERLVNRPGIQQVVVVKHQDRRLRQRGDLVEQHRQEGINRWRLRGLMRPHHPRANRRRNCLQRRDQVGEKTAGVAIAFVQ
jgi:hypothetical protein